MWSTTLLITWLLVVGAIASPGQRPKPLPHSPPCCSIFKPASSFHNVSRHCKMTTPILEPNTTQFKERNKSYFTAFNNDITPSKIACPDSVEGVSQLVQDAVKCNATIGVRGGGHTPWKGAANLEGRLVIDMRNLTGVTVSADKKTVSIKSGERWGRVYEKLAEEGFATVGGRVSRVGVSGLTLGGTSGQMSTTSKQQTYTSRRSFIFFGTIWLCLRCSIKLRGRPCFRKSRQRKQNQQSRSVRSTQRR